MQGFSGHGHLLILFGSREVGIVPPHDPVKLARVLKASRWRVALPRWRRNWLRRKQSWLRHPLGLGCWKKRTYVCSRKTSNSNAGWRRPARNSSTSSKPPSSDIVKPPKPPRKDGKKRNRGGQPGHEQHLRTPFPDEAIDNLVTYTLDCCPDCGGSLRPSPYAAKVQQEVEIVATPTIVSEHQALAYWCNRCGKLHAASLPEAVRKAGLLGPRMTALVAFMKGVCHASFSTIRKFLRDVVRVNVSRGYLAKLIDKVSEALAPSYAELFVRLPDEAVLHIDETGHKENGERFWTWCFRTRSTRCSVSTSRVARSSHSQAHSHSYSSRMTG